MQQRCHQHRQVSQICRYVMVVHQSITSKTPSSRPAALGPPPPRASGPPVVRCHAPALQFRNSRLDAAPGEPHAQVRPAPHRRPCQIEACPAGSGARSDRCLLGSGHLEIPAKLWLLRSCGPPIPSAAQASAARPASLSRTMHVGCCTCARSSSATPGFAKRAIYCG
jgi:hypothetical protein